MSFTKTDLLYEGKAKKLFRVKESSTLIYHEFKDSLTAFNGQKKSELTGKGALNRNISSLVFRYLNQKGQPSHWIADIGENAMVTKKVTIIPLEVVVRNIVAGSLAKKLNQEEGAELKQAIVDFHFKDDALGDPFISEDQAVYVLEAATSEEISMLKNLALAINQSLKILFEGIGLRLVDFKLEFGKLDSGEIVLADEISPDTCRLWDIKTGEKRDKDRFRRDLGDVLESYKIVWQELSNKYGDQL